MADALQAALEELRRVATEVGGAPPSVESMSRLGRWAECVIEWREVAKLTALRSPAKVVTELMLPALHALRLVGPVENVDIVDFGCGAGCTAVPLAEVSGVGNWVLMDRDERKIVFCRWALRECRIERMQALDEAEFQASGGTADILLARGLPRTPALAEALASALRPGGCIIRWVPEAIARAHAGAVRCGGTPVWVVRSAT